MAGRRPKSAALKLVTGNPGKRAVPDDEPVATPGWPDKPPGLGKDGSAEWDRLASLLDGELRLLLADGPHLLLAATYYQKAIDFQKKGKQRGLPHDEWRRFATGERIQWESYRKAVNDLCLSQGTRARAKVGRGKETSKLGSFLTRRKTGAPGKAVGA